MEIWLPWLYRVLLLWKDQLKTTACDVQKHQSKKTDTQILKADLIFGGELLHLAPLCLYNMPLKLCVCW